MDKEESAWNLKKEGGWDMYRKQSDDKAAKIQDITENNDLPIEDCMKRINSLNNKIKYAAFGKTRKTNSRKATLKHKNCPECGRLEDRPGPAKQMETQQRSQAPMSSHKEEIAGEELHGQIQKCSGLEVDSRSAQGMASQGHQV